MTVERRLYALSKVSIDQTISLSPFELLGSLLPPKSIISNIDCTRKGIGRSTPGSLYIERRNRKVERAAEVSNRNNLGIATLPEFFRHPIFTYSCSFYSDIHSGIPLESLPRFRDPLIRDHNFET